MTHIAKVNKIFSFNYKDQVFNVLYRTGKLRDGGERKFTMISLNRIPFPTIYRDGHLTEQEIITALDTTNEIYS
jgi:hypothetical protein